MMKLFNYIYKITNLANSKIYIGKHSTHIINDGYMGSGTMLRKAFKKYGIENFNKEYLIFCDTKEKLNWFEKFYIKKYKAKELGYNLTDGGDGGRTSGCFKKGHIVSEKTRNKISESLNGKKGTPHTNEFKKHISDIHKGKGNPMYGKNAEDFMTVKAIKEKRRKMSKANKGKFFSNEHKLNISIAKKGKHRVWNEEHTKYHYE